MMIKTQIITDKLAMTLSTVCMVHCFLSPSFIVLSFGFLPFSIDNEFIHVALLLFAFPISVFALARGYTYHKHVFILLLGILGITTLFAAVLLGEQAFRGIGEKELTLLGSVCVVVAHFRNYQICTGTDCSCHEQ